jgi:hypoxanthine phosphoribosyltransferase
MAERIVTMLTAEQIAARVKELGAEIAKDYADKRLVLVLVLKGSFMFGADLCRAIGLHGSDLTKPIEGDDVLLVEDIVDTGLTIAHLLDLLRTRKPRSVKVCSLLHKPARTKVTVPVDYLGFTIEDRFVIGYGLDWKQEYRDLPFVGVVERD